MECIKVRDRLAGYLQDDLRLTERLIVEVHVARCAACRASMDDLREVFRVCRQALRHPAPVDAYGELRERLAAADLAAAVPLREQLRQGRWPAAAGIAAAATVLAFASTPWLANRLSFDPLETAVDRAVIEDMTSMERRSDDAQRWQPAAELLGEDSEWGGAGTPSPPARLRDR